MKKVVIASNNSGKLREFAALLAPLGIEAVAQSALNISEADEPYDTFIENALTKARHASRHSGLPAMADDSGICVPALGGAPGASTAADLNLPRRGVISGVVTSAPSPKPNVYDTIGVASPSVEPDASALTPSGAVPDSGETDNI